MEEIATEENDLLNYSKRKGLHQTIARLITALETTGHSFAQILEALANFCYAERTKVISEKQTWDMIASLLRLASELAVSKQTEQGEAQEHLMLVLEVLTGRSWESQLDGMISEVMISLLQEVERSFADILLAIAEYAKKQSKNTHRKRDWKTIAALLHLAATQAKIGELM